MSVLFMNYTERLWPGFAASIGLLWALGRRVAPEVRLVVYLLLFVLMRDAMTPAGLWHIGTKPVFWIRFARDPVSLCMMGVSSLGLVYLLTRFEPELARMIVWRRKPLPRSLGLGLALGALIGAPAVLLALLVPAWGRGGSVPVSMWPAIGFLCLAGNLLEEVLFRGYVQAILEKRVGAGRAVLATGLAFAAAHGFLAAQTGGAGAAILIGFTLYEGVLCAWARRLDGIVASTLAHALGVFLVATGIPSG